MKAQNKTPQSSLYAGVLAFCLFVAGPGLLASNDSPPRVSYLEGTAAYEPAGDVDWSEVAVNLPLLSGDRIFSHPDSKVEVEVGRRDFLRLSEETDVSFVRATGDEVELNLNLGTVILRNYDSDRYVINTPLAGIRFSKKGLYRVSVDRDGTVRVAVRKGKAEIRNAVGSQKIESGQELIIEDTQSHLSNVVALSVEDAFDLWSDRRDARQVASVSVVRVGGSYIHGAYDLDYYGYWDVVPGYGHAWFPSVYVGWVPYRYGRWTHYPRWGWTWISYEPWGWLPYHTGSWFYYSHYSRWCWIPGVSFSWSPALVNFYFGGGYVGWAPRGYHHSTIINDNSVTVINNNTTIVNGWTRRGPGDGLTVVRQEDFARGARSAHLQNPERQLLERLQPGLPESIRETSRRGRSFASAASPMRGPAATGVSGERVSSRAADDHSSGWGSGSRGRISRSTSSKGADFAGSRSQTPSSRVSGRRAGSDPAAGSPGVQEVNRNPRRTEPSATSRSAVRERESQSSSRGSTVETPGRGSSSWSERWNYWGGSRGRGSETSTGTRSETRVITIPRRDSSRTGTSSGTSSPSLGSTRGSNWFGTSTRPSGGLSTPRGSSRDASRPESSVSSGRSPAPSGRSSLGSSRSNPGSGSRVTVVRPRSSGWGGGGSVAPRLSRPSVSASPGMSRSRGASSVPSVRPGSSSSGRSAGTPSVRRGRP